MAHTESIQKYAQFKGHFLEKGHRIDFITDKLREESAVIIHPVTDSEGKISVYQYYNSKPQIFTISPEAIVQVYLIKELIDFDTDNRKQTLILTVRECDTAETIERRKHLMAAENPCSDNSIWYVLLDKTGHSNMRKMFPNAKKTQCMDGSKSFDYYYIGEE